MNHAEDLASKLLQCSPKNRLSAQAALSHEYFSDLPPRLWELTDSEYDKFETSNRSRDMILASMCNTHVERFTCLYVHLSNIMYVCICIACTRVCVCVCVCVEREREREWGEGGSVCIYLVESCHSIASLPDTGRKWIPFLLSLLCSQQLHVFVFDYVCVQKNDLSSHKGKGKYDLHI